MDEIPGKKKPRIRQCGTDAERLTSDTHMFSSRNQPDIRPDGPDPLGSDYSPRDRDLDIMVGESLRQIPVNEGLVDRVREESLASWQQQARMRTGHTRTSIAIKRLALAACLGIAVLGAFWMTSPRLAQDQGTPLADAGQEYQDNAVPLEYLAAMDNSGLLTSYDLTWADAHDELLNILEAETGSDPWGYLAVELR